jgi:hypothetical protein
MNDAGIIKYEFSTAIDAYNACVDFYGFAAVCNGYYVENPPILLTNNPPLIGHRDAALFQWDTQVCAQVADAQTVLDGYATYVGECMQYGSDALAFTTADVAELSGYILLAWVLGYCGGFLVKTATKAVEMV